MTSENNTTSNIYSMQLHFDVRQISTALCFNLLKADGSAAIQKSGLAAGGYSLSRGDGINILISASFNKDAVPGIHIEGLTLVSLPAWYIEHCPVSVLDEVYLSPYDQNFATRRVDQWQPTAPPAGVLSFADDSTGQLYFKPGSSTVQIGDIAGGADLPILAKSGLWQIMGFLSVVVTTKEGVTHRVYTFDPDVMVGPGGLPPLPMLPTKG
ncbi:hypothetical protein UCD39_01280 [Nitrospirillum sp. BR 11752]|uniref:hypothetical protein n=1 Tax=Nitrospirillum sp. BR 11752 TaxID=3104293 RepID=UPI002ECC0EF8|nr:hypothetical protein [Nitrospirillum sp. BR 11752]